MNYQRLLTNSLRALPQGEQVAQIMAAALNAVDPRAAVERVVHLHGATLTISSHTIELTPQSRIFVVGAGKAGAPMAQAAAQVLGERLTAGVVVVKDGYSADLATLPATIRQIEAGHPVPDARGIAGTDAIATLLTNLSSDDVVLALISGGGSALLNRPVSGVSLADIQQLTTLLLHSGASINEINTLRKHLDTIKGGGLARLAAPAQLAALILSDVVGSPLDVIASGPTVADRSTYADALAIVDQYALAETTPPAIMQQLRRGATGQAEESLKPGDPRLEHVINVVVGSNPQAAQAAMAHARLQGFNTMLLSTSLQGEAREVGRTLAAIVRELAETGNPLPRPACIIAGGETTVTIRGAGLGGRNQELALAAVSELAELPNVALIALATDGGDGPTDAAGAVVTGQSAQHAKLLGLDPTTFLARNDAYHFFEPLGDLLQPGPTQTNVNDLTFLFAF